MIRFEDFEADELKGFPTKPQNYHDMRMIDLKENKMGKRITVTYDELEEILAELQQGMEDHVEPDLAPAHRQQVYSRMRLAFANAYGKIRQLKG